MSHYFQQLLTSSGLVQPAPTVAFLPESTPPAPADFSEISEETFAAPSGFSSPVPTKTAPEFNSPSVSKSPGGIRESHPTPASPHPEPGVVEINSPAITEQVIRLQPTVSADRARAIAAAPATPASKTLKPAESILPAAQAPVSEGESAPPSAASSAGVPSSEELIQHVFRWVAQNPTDLTPPTLSDSASKTGTPIKAAPIKSAIRPVTSATKAESIHLSASPALPSGRTSAPTPPPVPAVAVESTVEISIGTLQIQVEAPPAPAPKPARRPPSPRNTGTNSPAAVMPRPAIDLNRLRRGFYL